MQSIYLWEGRLEKQQEWMLLIKTVTASVSALELRLIELCVGHVGVLQAGTAQCRAREVGANQVRVAQVRHMHRRAREVGTGQVRAHAES